MAAEHQRIHLVHDVEAPHRPLVPQNITKSNDKGIPHRTFPMMHSKPPKRRRSYYCKFMCWTLSILLILIIAIAMTIGILNLVFRPKLSKYSADQLRISQFNVSDNNTLYATFNIAITARNQFAREITKLNYLLLSDPCPHPGHYNMVQNTTPIFQLHKLSNQFYGLQNPPKVVADFSPP
ncbi:NDR1/HIN1-like protein 6 [Glycine max]|nr:hypothetical protein JHK87_052810 [Glycine soja]KAH1193522.1 NDR1/HIN1-like protein 6 [Glycine max]